MNGVNKGRLHAKLDGFFPYGFVKELKAITKLSWPTMVTILFQYLIQPVSLMFCGHLGKTEIASAAMGISVIFLVCVSVGRALGYGSDTFFSQTYGSSNKKMMGVYLQKSLIYGVFFAALMCGVLLNTEKLLLLFGQDPDVARLTHEYTVTFMPGALGYCWAFILMRYLLLQNRVIPNMLISMITFGASVAMGYGLVYHADMGIKGSSISMALTYYVMVILSVAYLWGSGIYRETWPGWSWKCLEGWGSFASIILSSVLMMTVQWTYQQVATFCAGLLGEREVIAYSICFQVSSIWWMIPSGIGGAGTARVGQYLGSLEPLGAITASRVAIALSGLVASVASVASYLLRWYIIKAFTSKTEVMSYTADMMYFVSICILLDTNTVGVCIIRATGRLKLTFAIDFLSYFITSSSLGVLLTFAAHLGLPGNFTRAESDKKPRAVICHIQFRSYIFYNPVT